jgi:cobyrinic acid a,c-diamide synthase
MPPEICRTVFARGAHGVDLAVVEGVLGSFTNGTSSRPCASRAFSERHGSLAGLSETLDLPLVYAVDCRGWTERHLPWIPHDADAVILDGVQNAEQGETLKSMVRMLLGKPVLGAIDDCPTLRDALGRLPLGQTVPKDWVDALARSFLRTADIEAIRTVSESRLALGPDGCDDSSFAYRHPNARRLRVAYAMDEAFGDYFPDTLETLELLGAELFEFSPLRDEALPHGVELVMIGCGFPDRFAEDLAANHSLIAELRAHVCGRGRIYAEGGGMAYLSRSMILPGRQVAGAGILPIDAELIAAQGWPEPVERTLNADSWLGSAGTVVRGYRSHRWNLSPASDPGDCPARSGALTCEGDILYRYQAIGGLIHLHLAALPEVVARFVGRTNEHTHAGKRLLH